MIEQKKTQWYCQTCNQYFINYNQLRKHKSIHPHKCKFCGELFTNPCKLAGHTAFCKNNPNYQKNMQQAKQNGKNKPFKHHSKQTKKLLSQKRKQYLKEHPNEHVWKKNEIYISKPCQDLKQFLLDNNINFYPQYTDYQIFQNHNYAIDIAFPNQKIAIQVNGKQHYNKNGTLQYYFKIRHEILEKAGWKVIEVPNNKTYSIQFRQSLLKLITQNVNFDYDYTKEIWEKKKQKEQQHICPLCGGEKKKSTSIYCSKCRNEILSRSIPTKQQLIKDLEQLKSKEAIGRKYNKTGTAVRRWFRKYNLKLNNK